MTLLDAILRETNRDKRAGMTNLPGRAGLVLPERAEAERSRIATLADRSGPKGALAGHLEGLLRHS
jgi:hypothetical protein